MAHLATARVGGAGEPGRAALAGRRAAGAVGVERLVAPALALALVTAWELAARAGWLSPLYYPAPSRIGAWLVTSLLGGELARSLAATTLRLTVGFACGAIPALALGVWAGWSPRARAVIDPFVAAFHPVPKIAFLPLLMLLVGIGEPSRLVIIALGACFPVLLNAMAGVRQIPALHFEVAGNYGASASLMLRRVVVPGSLPAVLTGIRLGLNRALLLTITVELIGAPDGLGALIWLARETLRTEELYGALVLIMAMGIGMNAVLRRARLWAGPWLADSER